MLHESLPLKALKTQLHHLKYEISQVDINAIDIMLLQD